MTQLTIAYPVRAPSSQNSTEKFTAANKNLSLLSALKQGGNSGSVSKQPIGALGFQNCREWVGMIPVNGGPPVSKPSQSQGGLSRLSLESRSPAGGWGAGSPIAGSCGHPYPSSSSPRCIISHPPTPYLGRACPSSQVLEFRVLSPLGCAQGTPKPSIIY